MTADTPPLPVPPPPFRAAAAYWFRLGCVSFGGPTGQIAMMHRELVERRRWISERRFLHALNYCMVLPGPEAQQLAVYIGWLLHGTWGGVAAGTLFVLPSLVLLIALSWAYMTLGDLPAVAGVLYGVKPAVVAIVLFAALRIGTRTLHNVSLAAIAVAAFAAIFVLEVPFPAIVLAAGAVGWLGGRLAPRRFQVAGGHGAAAHPHPPALIDDATPPPPHARFGWMRLIQLALTGVALLAAGLLGLALAFGPASVPAQMALFFTKAAFVTFGGAYAVLPYVYDAAVKHHGWLTAPQMIDGLALGETTPGPLIMVVAFVGFVGGWSHAPLGPDAVLPAAVLTAVVATLFTFLPSFFFILAGGPAVEATHGDLRFTAPLTAVTAAVVGVIVNLAVFFAWHVFWPGGLAGPFDGAAAAIAVAAFAALHRFRVGVVPVIATCAAAGLAWHLVRWG